MKENEKKIENVKLIDCIWVDMVHMMKGYLKMQSPIKKFYKIAIEDIINYNLEIYPELLTVQQVNKDRQNLGMIAVLCGFDGVVEKVLENPTASTQVNKDGRNIGMLAAISGNVVLANEAKNYAPASAQKDKHGKTIENYITSSQEHLDSLDEKFNRVCQENFEKNANEQLKGQMSLEDNSPAQN
jgi:hypothetical protein